LKLMFRSYVWKRYFVVSVYVLLGSLTVLLVLDHFDVCIVDSNSMWPTLRSGQRILVTRFNHNSSLYHRGDIVVFYAPTEHGLAVKRLVGLPGDRIGVRDGRLFLNGRQVDEPYINLKAKPGGPPANWPIVSPGTAERDRYVEIPEYHFFVLGDNRNISIDSRVWGPLPEDSIYGREYIASIY
jgi:signal peptidase I